MPSSRSNGVSQRLSHTPRKSGRPSAVRGVLADCPCAFALDTASATKTYNRLNNIRPRAPWGELVIVQMRCDGEANHARFSCEAFAKTAATRRFKTAGAI